MTGDGSRIHGDLEPAELRQERALQARTELAGVLGVPLDEVQIQTVRREQSVILNAVWIPGWRLPA